MTPSIRGNRQSRIGPTNPGPSLSIRAKRILESPIGKASQLETKLLIKDDASCSASRSPVTRRINPGFQGEVSTEIKTVAIGDDKNIIAAIKQEGSTHLRAGAIATSFDNLDRLGANIKGRRVIDRVNCDRDSVSGG